MEILAIIAIMVLIVGLVIQSKPKHYRVRRTGKHTYVEPREEGLSLWGRKT